MKVEKIPRTKTKYKMIEDGIEEYFEVRFIANDGKVFYDKYKCENHEKELQREVNLKQLQDYTDTYDKEYSGTGKRIYIDGYSYYFYFIETIEMFKSIYAHYFRTDFNRISNDYEKFESRANNLELNTWHGFNIEYSSYSEEGNWLPLELYKKEFYDNIKIIEGE